LRQQQRRKRAGAKWRKLICQQAKSGQSVAAFCRERGLCAPHFFQWKKRLSDSALGSMRPAQLMPQEVADDPKEFSRLETNSPIRANEPGLS
jgi:hypothetical protein